MRHILLPILLFCSSSPTIANSLPNNLSSRSPAKTRILGATVQAILQGRGRGHLSRLFRLLDRLTVGSFERIVKVALPFGVLVRLLVRFAWPTCVSGYHRRQHLLPPLIPVIAKTDSKDPF